MEERKIPLFVFRLKSGKHNAAWELATSLAEIEARAAAMRQAEPDLPETERWETGQVIELGLSDHAAGAIGGYLVGSRTSSAKAAAAKANGQRGGRPKGTGKNQRAAAAADEKAKLDTLPLNPEVIPVEAKKPKGGKK